MCKHFPALVVRKLADVNHLVIFLCDISKFRIRNVKILFYLLLYYGILIS